METRFFTKLKKDRLLQKCNSFCFSLLKYKELIEKVKSAKQKTRKTSNDYKLLQRFDVLEVNGVEKLIEPIKENVGITYFVHDEELFGILNNVHLSIGHGGRDRMIKELKIKYRNITYKDVNIYLSVCESCLQKQKREMKGVVVRPLLFEELNSRCQVDLIDYQSHPDGEFKFVMVYQDHLTKFVVLRALQSNRAQEVTEHLIDIFTLLGAPAILQSNNGREFVNHIIENLKILWPDLRLVHGKQRDSQSQESIECANRDIENILTSWMQDNQTSDWTKGLKFVQLMKNKAYHSDLRRSPYEALFGHPLKLGLATSNISQEVLEGVQEETDIENIINSITSVEDDQDETKEDNETVEAVEESEMDNAEIIEGDNAFFNLKQTAKRMNRISDYNYSSITPGNTVRIPIPEVDRGHEDMQYILATVLEVTEGGFYKLGTRNGVLKQLYARSQIYSYPEAVIAINEVPNKEISFHTVANLQSTDNGQGFSKRRCKMKCTNNK